MIINNNTYGRAPALLLATVLAAGAHAHDPVFGLGPHTLFKDGVELHLGAHQEKSAADRVVETEMQLKYGITGDWVAGVAVPYTRDKGSQDASSGRGATSLSSKYRFWRDDMPGAQASAAVLGRVILDDGTHAQHDQSTRDGNDYLLGLTYGYEGRKWYRWSSLRRRFNSDSASDTNRPDITKLDLVVGIRPTPSEYREPDWVWMLELNGEIIEDVSNAISGSTVKQGGEQWFISPGLMWTLRNMAVKAGVQLPIYSNFRADQDVDDYRLQLELEWHL